MPVVWSRRRFLAISLALCVGAAAGFQSLRHKQGSTFDGIQIRGDTKFFRQVEASLTLMRTSSPDGFALTQQYVKRIQQSSRSGMRAYAARSTFDLGTETAYYSVTWCAGAIAHDAFHSKLYHEYRDAFGEPVPDDAWCGQANEVKCNDFQLRVLREIGAPDHEIDYLSKLDGTHYDFDGDGQATWKDYWARDW